MVDIVRKRFGLLGRNINYSFPRDILQINSLTKTLKVVPTRIFDIPEIDAFTEIIKNTADLKRIECYYSI